MNHLQRIFGYLLPLLLPTMWSRQDLLSGRCFSDRDDDRFDRKILGRKVGKNESEMCALLKEPPYRLTNLSDENCSWRMCRTCELGMTTRRTPSPRYHVLAVM